MTEHRLEVEEPERLPVTIGDDGKCEVSEEALAGPDESAEPFTLRIAAELELRRIVQDEHVLVRQSTARRLPIVRPENRFRRDLRVAEVDRSARLLTSSPRR